MEKIQGVIFDLDGTLLDTIDDIAHNLNIVLKKHGYKTYTSDECKIMICDGAKMLVKRALPADITEEELEAILAEYKKQYRENVCIKTKPYNGIPELLKTLEKLNIKIAVVTNKPQATTDVLMSKLLNNFKFAAIEGQKDSQPHKPNPQQTNMVIENIGAKAENVLFVGDSAVDIKTAKNADTVSVGVTWGFRTRSELEESGADYIIDTPEQLLDIIKL